MILNLPVIFGSLCVTKLIMATLVNASHRRPTMNKTREYNYDTEELGLTNPAGSVTYANNVAFPMVSPCLDMVQGVTSGGVVGNAFVALRWSLRLMLKVIGDSYNNSANLSPNAECRILIFKYKNHGTDTFADIAQSVIRAGTYGYSIYSEYVSHFEDVMEIISDEVVAVHRAVTRSGATNMYTQTGCRTVNYDISLGHEIKKNDDSTNFEALNAGAGLWAPQSYLQYGGVYCMLIPNTANLTSGVASMAAPDEWTFAASSKLWYITP